MTAVPLTWFAAYTAPRAERRAEVDLIFRGFEVFLPKITRWDRHGVRKGVQARRKVEEPLFPRYLFIGLQEPENWGEGVLNRAFGKDRDRGV